MSNGNGDLRIGGGSSANDDIIIDNDGLVSFFGNIELNGSSTRQIRFDDGTESEGAIVFDPDPGLYYSPTAVLDYASLYPRSMIHKNLSHETIVLDDLYDNLPEYDYFDKR